ncbi:hypothetical protein FACS1894163_06640 [Spirochaetia bacterium]|nr:hypothetical protein FACS1894163_06640 [Spirochaetia bacterium]
MGTGIGGAIPTSIYFRETWDKDLFIEGHKNFFDFYHESVVVKGRQVYAIEPSILLPHFKDYLTELYTILGEQDVVDGFTKFDEAYDAIIVKNDLDAFLQHFNRNGAYQESFQPDYWKDGYFFSTGGFECLNFLYVYNGSYKAYLEEYTTLHHMERLLAKAMDNPLARITKFGIFG